MTKIFIVDDHYMVVEGIRSLLQNAPGIDWMGHAMNAASCLAFLQQQHPDIILMDINLPDKSGIDLCKEVHNKYPGIFILGLSTFNQQSFIQKMMDNGASGYILKNASLDELLEAINEVKKGRTFLSNEAAATLHKPDNTTIPLITSREKEVLGLVAEGLTNNEIAQQLFISHTTVETHRKSLLNKFDAKNTASLVRMAAQMGII
ncbi:MAG: response regulator transcription factor [Bacteroidetes bacterium]|nr:response regulator transcription factor [Bacteroidota bacterium]